MHTLQEKLKHGVLGMIQYGFLLLLTYLVLLVLFWAKQQVYPWKKTFPASNAVLLLLGLAVMAFGCFVYSKCLAKRLNAAWLDKHFFRIGVILWLAQVYICYNYYFLTDWDVSAVYQSATLIASGEVFSHAGLMEFGEQFGWYYSRYPNNLAMLAIFTLCLVLNRFFGVLDPENGVMVFIALNCMISTFTGWLAYKTLRLLASAKAAVIGWLAYMLFIWLSPWTVIPYSDAVGLLFPTLIYYLYRKPWAQKYAKWKWFTLAGVSGIAYQIKAQAAIVFIAIVLYEGVRWLARVKRIERKDIRAGLMIAVPLAVCLLAPKVVPLHWERTFGIEHFLMMGMNPTSQGVYSDEDAAFSASFKTKAERKQAEWNVIRERLRDYGVAGWLRLAQTKLLTVYSDGTYAWGCEGTYFYAQIPEEKNHGLSPFLRSLYYGGGTRHPYFCAYAQMCWLVILVGTWCSGFVGRRQPDQREALYPLWLAVLGITLFEVLFEARARYLYTLAPLFLILAVMGYRNVWQQIAAALAHRKQRCEALASENKT